MLKDSNVIVGNDISFLKNILLSQEVHYKKTNLIMFQNSKISHQTTFHNQTLTLETGLLAQQATSSVIATIGETTVMANLVVGKPTTGDYFPLQLIYEEKMYASGKIKGSRFMKREGRPSDNAVLTGRMIDRSIRSLFNPYIRNEVQLIITVLSVDEVNPPDTLAVLAASTALGLCQFETDLELSSNDLYAGPVSSVRVGLIQEKIQETLLQKLENELLLAESFNDVLSVLTEISEVLNLDNPLDKKYLKKAVELLAKRNPGWKTEFSQIWKTTPKKTQQEILNNYSPKQKFLVNPSYTQQTKSEVDIVISGNGQNVMMLEAGANIVPEETINQCLNIANQELEFLTNFQKEFIQKAKQENLIKNILLNPVLAEKKFETYWNQFKNDLELAIFYPGTKDDRKQKLSDLKEKHFLNLELLKDLASKQDWASLDSFREFLIINSKDQSHPETAEILNNPDFNLEISQNLLDLLEDEKPSHFESKLGSFKTQLESSLEVASKKIIKNKILTEEKRVDGRKLDEVRPILIEVGNIPRVHGSSLFQRGETQVLNILTLGTSRDAQLLDDMEDFEEVSKRYIHHYNFPSYSVGETGRYGPVGRREIGHGALAEKALLPVLPDEDSFPYTMRLVSECLGSNGSTSMASTCASCLSLMQGGVPITDMVAGVAMGLVLDTETKNFKVLTDIQGLEDHNGDMDFKVTGTANGITAIQLDNKVAGLTVGILSQALLEAKKGRIHILNEMKKVITKPNPEISKYAPGVAITQVPVEKIGDVIGPSGKIIKGISSKYEVEIEIEDATGKTFIFGKDTEKVLKAKKTIEKIIKGYQAGEIVSGEIYRIEPFGAFMDIIEDGDKVGKDGMIHISNLSETRIKDVQSVVKIGDKVECKILSVNEKGQLELKLLGKK